MDRRRFLLVGGAAAFAASTIRPTAAAWASTDTGLPVFEWSRPGGFFAPGQAVMDPPRLAVADDNTAYADAAATLRLSADEAAALRAQAIDALDEPVTGTDGDHPADVIRVRAYDRSFLSTRLDRWPRPGFPIALYELEATVERIRRRVLRGGEPWRPEAALLAAVHLDDEPSRYREWPRHVPVPIGRLYGETSVRGARARVVHRMPRAPRDTVWPMYRVAKDHYVAATWRYLLPHE